MPSPLRQFERARRRALNSPERLAAVERFRELLSDDDAGLQTIANVAATVCDAPIALITLVDHDRVWVKAKVGVSARETALSSAICTRAIGHEGVFLVADATVDPRINTSPLVTGPLHVGSYAGAPLVTDDGFTVGMMCVLYDKARPKGFAVEETTTLQRLAAAAVQQFEQARRIA